MMPKELSDVLQSSFQRHEKRAVIAAHRMSRSSISYQETMDITLEVGKSRNELISKILEAYHKGDYSPDADNTYEEQQ
jgi:hypothetical protein